MASVWAIGDIHGENVKLDALLSALPRGEDDYTVFLGDYIDRGPDSAAVVRRALIEHSAAPDRTILLWGNHEDMAASHWNFPAPSGFEYDAYDWFRNGGVRALESFGFKVPELYVTACPDDLARLFGLLKTFWRPPVEKFPGLEHVIYVHAGILPGRQPEDSPGQDLLWVREDFLDVPDFSGRLVIHGHTPIKGVEPKPDKIGLDTGAVYGGVLSALQMPERRLYQADANGSILITDI